LKLSSLPLVIVEALADPDGRLFAPGDQLSRLMLREFSDLGELHDLGCVL
jgi:hypothetical protein